MWVPHGYHVSWRAVGICTLRNARLQIRQLRLLPFATDRILGSILLARC